MKTRFTLTAAAIFVAMMLAMNGCGSSSNIGSDSDESNGAADEDPSGSYSYYFNWMSVDPMIQKSSLSEIAIPGAHDAGMGKIASCSALADSKVTKTQSKSFFNMLNDGIRYFDIRPIIDKSNTMQIGHYSWIEVSINLLVVKFALGDYEGCYGYSIDNMLDDVNNFMEKSQHEVVVLDLSHFMNFKKYDNKNSYFDGDDFKRLAERINEKIGNYLVKDNVDLVHTPIETLTENGSKVIVIFNDSSYTGTYEGIYHKAAMDVYNKYSDTNDFNKMKDDQFEKSKAYSDDKYFLLSWTLTLDKKQAEGCIVEEYIDKASLTDYLRKIALDELYNLGYKCESIENLAKEANSHINGIPNDSTEGNPNIILSDYVSNAVTLKSIGINGNRLHYKWTTPVNIPDLFGNASDGGGITMGDTDGDGIPNLVVFHIDHPKYGNKGYYRVSSNLNNDGTVNSWGDRIGIPVWFGYRSAGGGITMGDTDGDGIPNLVIFQIDNPKDGNKGYYFVSSNLNNDGTVNSWGDPIRIPVWFGDHSAGGGITMGDTDGDGIPNLAVFHIDNPEGGNEGYYRVSSNLNNDGTVNSWGDPIGIPGWFGDDSQGGGITMGDIDGDGIPNLAVFYIDNPSGGNEGYYRVSSNLNNDGTVNSWGNPIGIPGWFGDHSAYGGITMGDTDGDGIPNLAVFHINNPEGENKGFYRVGSSLEE